MAAAGFGRISPCRCLVETFGHLVRRCRHGYSMRVGQKLSPRRARMTKLQPGDEGDFLSEMPGNVPLGKLKAILPTEWSAGETFAERQVRGTDAGGPTA